MPGNSCRVDQQPVAPRCSRRFSGFCQQPADLARPPLRWRSSSGLCPQRPLLHYPCAHGLSLLVAASPALESRSFRPDLYWLVHSAGAATPWRRASSRSIRRDACPLSTNAGWERRRLAQSLAGLPSHGAAPMVFIVASALVGLAIYFYCLCFANPEWKLFLAYCAAVFLASLRSPMTGDSSRLGICSFSLFLPGTGFCPCWPLRGAPRGARVMDATASSG